MSAAATAFLDQLFSNGLYLEQSFDKICADGCPSQDFGIFLYLVCTISSVRSDLTSLPVAGRLLVNSGEISTAQLRALPGKLRAVADMIDKLNATILGPANEMKMFSDVPDRKAAREYLIRRYETLPGLLRVYSWHVDRFKKFARTAGKRLTLGHVEAIRIVRYVEDRTESPHYKEMAQLLEQGWMLAGKTESVPDFLSVEGLTKLYQRWGDAVCGPKRNPVRD